MAEGHAEDAPLLGGADSISPGDCSPERQPGGGGVPPVWSTPAVGQSATAEVRQPWPPDAWVRGAHLDTLHVPAQGDNTPKLVRSQSSMDSGCECDGGDGDGSGPHDSTNTTSTLPHHVHQETTSSSSTSSSTSSPPHHHVHHHHHPNHTAGGPPTHDPAGFSPLSPSQPGSNSGPPTPGPSSQVVVVVTPNAPHTYSHIPDCDSPPGRSANHQSCVCDIGVGVAGAICPDPRVHADPHTKVTFMIDDEDDDDFNHDSCGGGGGMNAIETASLSGSEPGEDFKEQLRHHAAASFPRVPSYSRTGVLSASSSTASMPMCRICHHPQGDGLDTLISPCRCAGTMQFIHQGCLNKWLEVKRSKKAPACELCNYQFHRHKKFRLNHWQLPSCSRADKILHSIFLVCLIIMAACATITIICFKQDRVLPKKNDDAELTKSEVVTLTCGVLFFVAFFVAMYVEVKARNTLYRLFTRFLYLNQTWHIAEYDRRKDSQFGHAPV